MRNTSRHPIKASYLASLLHQLGELKNGLGCNDIQTLLIAQVGNHSRFTDGQFWAEFYTYAQRLNYSFKKIRMNYTIAKAIDVQEDGMTIVERKAIIRGERSFITSQEAEAFNERLATIKMKLSFRSAGEPFTKLNAAYKNRKTVDKVSSRNLFSLNIQVCHM